MFKQSDSDEVCDEVLSDVDDRDSEDDEENDSSGIDEERNIPSSSLSKPHHHQ